jgi:hypothetical protein
MTVRHYLIGYGKDHAGPEIEYVIPEDQMAEVKKLLSLYPDDADALDPYELYAWQATRIAALAGKTVNSARHHFWLQAFDDPDPMDAPQAHRAVQQADSNLGPS